MRKTDFEAKYLGSCSVCEISFQPRSANLISRKDEVTQIYAQCSNCKSSVIIFVLKSAMGFVTTVGMLTDMTKRDLEKFSKTNPITADDILELHKSLEDK